MIRKHYKLGLIIILCTIMAGWVAFLDIDQNAKQTGKQEVQPTREAEPARVVSPSDTPASEPAIVPESFLTPTVTLTLTPTAMPTLTPTPIPVTVTPTPVPTATPMPTATPIPAPSGFNYVLAHVNEMLNVRSGPSEADAIIGKMVPDSYGIILERGTEWYKIKSGPVTGYVFSDFLYIDDEAVKRARQLDALYVEVTADSINIRVAPNTDCDVLAQTKRGNNFKYVPEKSNAEWYAIQYDSSTVAYIAAGLCEIDIRLDTAIEAN